MSAEHAHRPGPDDAQSNGARVDSVSVSGFEMYYESWGAGRPLVLLHGAISTIEPSFGAVIPRVAQTRRLIAVEQQAPGRTADIERPLTYTQMAEDTATLVRKLKIDHADFFGYSMGAGIALELAVRYPQLVRRLIVASLAYRNDGFHPDTAAQLWKPSPVGEDRTGAGGLAGPGARLSRHLSRRLATVTQRTYRCRRRPGRGGAAGGAAGAGAGRLGGRCRRPLRRRRPAGHG